MDTDDSLNGQTPRTGTLPAPSRSSRWRWSTTRSAAFCGSALVGALAFGGVAGAATTHTGKPPAAHGPGPGGRGVKPTAAGKITALSGDSLTIVTRNATATVLYSSSTKFTTMSGSTAASDLKVGEFIAVQGTKASNGDVTATTIMISTGPPGGPGGKPGSGHPPKGGMGPKG